MESGKADWQNLPKDLLEMLSERTEIRLIRAVCSSWRSSLLHNSKKSPLFSVKIPLPDPNNRLHFTLTERNIYCLQPLSDENNCNDSESQSDESNDYECQMGWMVKLEETSSGKMKPFDTLSNSSYRPKSRKKLPSELNLFDYHVFGVAKEYKLTCVGPRYIKEEFEITVLKVIMAPVHHHAIMCIFQGRQLGHFKYGDENWTMIDDGLSETCDYSDIIHHKEKFYVIDSIGNVIVVDSSFNVKVVAYPTHFDCRIQYGKLALVESNGDLFVVKKHYSSHNDSKGSNDDDYNDDDDYNEDNDHNEDNDYDYDDDDDKEIMVSFKVFKFNSDKTEWVEVTYLRDQSFFIGDECCFSVSTTQISCCVRNSIYFKDSEFVRENFGFPGYGAGIFLLGDRYAEPFMFNYGGCSQIFWPIPTWLKPKGA